MNHCMDPITLYDCILVPITQYDFINPIAKCVIGTKNSHDFEKEVPI